MKLVLQDMRPTCGADAAAGVTTKRDSGSCSLLGRFDMIARLRSYVEFAPQVSPMYKWVEASDTAP